MKQKKITQEIFLLLIALLGFNGLKAELSAPSMTIPCTAGYSVTNALGIVLTSGSLGNQNPISLGALCPGLNLIVKLITPSFTTTGAYVSIGTSSTPITYTLLNTGTNTISIPITVFDPTQTLPALITVGPSPQFDGDGCYIFTFDIYPLPSPNFIISPNPVCLNSSVCFSATASPYTLATQNWGGYYMQPMTQTLYNNIVANLVSPNYTGSVTCNPATAFGLGTYTVTNTTSIGLGKFCFNSQTKTFTVVPALGTVSISGPTAVACTGQNGTLTASATGATSYTWYPGGTIGNQIVVSPTVNTTYTVTAINANGCTNSAVYEYSVGGLLFIRQNHC
ncbi:MAG: hypothetical protein H0U95_10910 [Bacteroidetes bacterium]|nr:hypothetical protein [Bacteroidota bacterium]